MYKNITTLLVASMLTTNVFSETIPDSKTWKGSAELGFVSTSGNTETETINAKGIIINEQQKWRHTGELAALKSSDNISTTAQKYSLSAQSDYKFSEHNYMLGIIRYEDDLFNGYDYRISEALGYGRRIIAEPKMILDLEVGPGARQSKLDNGMSQNEGFLRGAGKFAWTVSDTSKLTEVLVIEAGNDTTISKSVTTLTSQIAGSLAMKVSHTINHTSEVPVGIEKTGTETGVTLVYSF